MSYEITITLYNYVFTFEGENEMKHMVIAAPTFKDAMKSMKIMFPDDIGADGFCVTESGSEIPMNW